MPSGASKQLKSDAGLDSALRSSILRLSRLIRRTHAYGGELSANRQGVMVALSRSGAMTIGELAVHENVKPPSMTRTVSNLEGAGLVRRMPHSTDKRVVLVDLTDAAHALLAANRRRRDEWLEIKLKTLTREERDVLRKAAAVLERLAAS